MSSVKPSTFGPLTDQLFGTRSAGDLLQKAGTKHIVYPPGLATSASDPISKQQNQIPYVLFMPYLPPKGFHAFHSLDPNQVLDTLPAPEFSIALPIPSSALKTTYGVHYSEIELGQGAGALINGAGKLTGGLYDIAKDAFDARTKVADQVANFNRVMSGGVDAVGQLGYSLAKAAAEGVGLGGALDKFIGVAENPFTEHVFQKVESRTHSFTYTFLPKNRSESETIDNIIELFKFYMLPANKAISSSGGLPIFFSFPYEFQIIYSVGATTFQLLPSVLETLTVDYADQVGSPKFFTSNNGENQYPAKVDLTMTFQEVMLLTRDKIKVDWKAKDMPDKPTDATVSRYRF